MENSPFAQFRWLRATDPKDTMRYNPDKRSWQYKYFDMQDAPALGIGLHTTEPHIPSYIQAPDGTKELLNKEVN